MTDITTKLRSGSYGILAQELNFESADEIDRLRAEVAGYAEANRHLIDMHDAVIDDARKYSAAQAEIARLREALTECIPALEVGLDAAGVIGTLGDGRPTTIRDALKQARAALAPAAEVSGG